MPMFRPIPFMRVLCLGLISLLLINPSFALPNANTEKHVAIIQVIEHPALDATRQGILDTLKNKGISVKFQSAQGNSALATQIAQQFVGTKPDVMVGIGTLVTQALISADQHQQIPIVFSSVTDPKGSKIVNNLEHPEGVVTGVSNFVDPTQQFALFKKILPKLTKLGIIYNPGEANSVSLNDTMQSVALQQGLTLVFASANTTADVIQATQQLLSKGIDAIFINNDSTALAAFDSIVKISTPSKIPVFCSDTDMIAHGALAALGPNQYEIGKQTGTMILQILEGKTPAEIPVAFPDKTEVFSNPKQAKKLGIVLP